jgi:hypothetical protein
MPLSIIVHINNEDPIACEIEKMPDPGDQIMILNNPRMRDGKDLHYLQDDVTTMILPWHRINFIQIMPSAEIEEIVTFVRE